MIGSFTQSCVLQEDKLKQNPAYIPELLKSAVPDPELRQQIAAVLQCMLHPDLNSRATAPEVLTMAWFARK